MSEALDNNKGHERPYEEFGRAFLAALVGVWVEHQFGGPWAEDDVLLCQGDSSSASGWIMRSSFGDECPLHLAIARTMAKYMSNQRLHHYS